MEKHRRSILDKFLDKNFNLGGWKVLADPDDRTIGFIAGIVKEHSKEDLLQYIPSKVGRILELFVEPEYQKKGLGSMLMKETEGSFRRMQKSSPVLENLPQLRFKSNPVLEKCLIFLFSCWLLFDK